MTRHPYTLKQSLQDLAAADPEAAETFKRMSRWTRWLGASLAALLFAAIVLNIMFSGTLLTVVTATLVAGAITLGAFIDVPFSRAFKDVEPLSRFQQQILRRRTRLLRAGQFLLAIGAGCLILMSPLSLSPATAWSVAGPLILVGIVLPMVAPLTSMKLFRQVLRFRGELCPGCAYRLEGLLEEGVCPECGSEYELESARESWSRTFGKSVTGVREIRSHSQDAAAHSGSIEA